MYRINTQPEDLSSNRENGAPPAGARNLCQNYPASYSSEIRNQVIAFYNPKHQGRLQAISRHGGLILDLKAIQPASLSEIAEEVGQSTSSVRNHLKRLTQLDLVVRIAFEHHTLYCLNGDYNVHIERILRELYE
jgi:DNA-binding transcriptional ArsR family regulator